MTTTAPDADEATQALWAPPETAVPAASGAPSSPGESPPAEPPSWATGFDDPARPPRRRRPRPARTPLPWEARLLIQILLTLSVGALGLVVYLLVVGPIQQGNDQDRLYATFREQLALATAPTGGFIEPGTPVALLTIPGLKDAGFGKESQSLNHVVVQGTSSGDLEVGPGHLRNTPLPGQAGVSYIYGKSSTFGAPFRQIDRLRRGDRITVTTGQGAFTYRVSGVRRQGDSMPPALAKGAGRLTLVTSDHPNVLKRSYTLYVDADLLDQPQPTPSGQPQLIPAQEKEMATDAASGNLGLVLWLQALGLVIAGVVWARHRWGKRETLVAGIPVVLAVVWNLYETVGRLLPNLL